MVKDFISTTSRRRLAIVQSHDRRLVRARPGWGLIWNSEYEMHGLTTQSWDGVVVSLPDALTDHFGICQTWYSSPDNVLLSPLLAGLSCTTCMPA